MALTAAYEVWEQSVGLVAFFFFSVQFKAIFYDVKLCARKWLHQRYCVDFNLHGMAIINVIVRKFTWVLLLYTVCKEIVANNQYSKSWFKFNWRVNMLCMAREEDGVFADILYIDECRIFSECRHHHVSHKIQLPSITKHKILSNLACNVVITQLLGALRAVCEALYYCDFIFTNVRKWKLYEDAMR